MSSAVLPPDQRFPLLGPLPTNRTQGIRMLAFLCATGTIESINSQLRDRKGLAHGTCRAFGLAANTT